MLADSLKVYLATNTSFYLKAHGFHWNVTGSNFPQYHQLFDMIYTDSYGAIDQIAEYIRALDEFAPASFSRYVELSEIDDQTKIPKAELMIKELLKDNDMILDMLKDLFDEATEARENGIANFIADRQSMHGKWHWQLSATLG
jgi:starvation-inducible DNA-binding protein